MKKVVVNDTNVFIDLFDVGLLEGLFSLPWEVHTTELVMLELQREGEAETVNRYKEEGRLHVPVFSPKEMMQIVALLPRTGVTPTFPSQIALYGIMPRKTITPC